MSYLSGDDLYTYTRRLSLSATLLLAASPLLAAEETLPLTLGEPTPIEGIPFSAGGVYRGCMTEDRLTLYYDMVDVGAIGRIFRAVRAGPEGPFEGGAPLEGPIGRPGTELESVMFPALSRDGSRLYFTRWIGQGGMEGADIWVAARSSPEDPDAPFEEVLRLPAPVNCAQGCTWGSDTWSLMGSVSLDGAEIFFVRDFKLWVAKFEVPGDPERGFRDARQLLEVSYVGYDYPPSITPDGLHIFWSERPEGHPNGLPPRPGSCGKTDLWVASRLTLDPDARFGEPINLGCSPEGPNTVGVELCPWVSPDGRTLLFGRGKEGLWQVDLTAVQTSFRRGDANADGATDISDAVATLTELFLDGVDKLPCEGAGDANDDGQLDISDPVFLLAYLFLGGNAPDDPLGSCGVDPTPDGLTCESFPACP